MGDFNEFLTFIVDGQPRAWDSATDMLTRRVGPTSLSGAFFLLRQVGQPSGVGVADICALDCAGIPLSSKQVEALTADSSGHIADALSALDPAAQLANLSPEALASGGAILNLIDALASTGDLHSRQARALAARLRPEAIPAIPKQMRKVMGLEGDYKNQLQQVRELVTDATLRHQFHYLRLAAGVPTELGDLFTLQILAEETWKDEKIARAAQKAARKAEKAAQQALARGEERARMLLSDQEKQRQKAEQKADKEKKKRAKAAQRKELKAKEEAAFRAERDRLKKELAASPFSNISKL